MGVAVSLLLICSFFILAKNNDDDAYFGIGKDYNASSLLIKDRVLSLGSNKNTNFTSLYGVNIGKLSDPLKLDDIPVFLDLAGGSKSSSSFCHSYLLSRCIDPSIINNDNSNNLPKRIIYTNSPCNIYQCIKNPNKERVRLFLILRDPLEHTLLSYNLKKDINHPTFDERMLGLDFSKYLDLTSNNNSPSSLLETDQITKSMLCKGYNNSDDDNNVITNSDFNDLKQFLKNHVAVQTLKGGYKNATINFQQIFFGSWISSTKTNDRLKSCFHKVIAFGRRRLLGTQNNNKDVIGGGIIPDDELRNKNKYDSKLYDTYNTNDKI